MKIDSLSYNGGRGVGRHEGIVVFVPGTAPDDIVRVRVINKKPRFWEGEVVEIVKTSPHRREPPCPVATRCGGCSWQHISYSTQVAQKEKILRDSLRPLAKLGPWEWLPFLAAPEEFHYRNRIQLQIHGKKFGFFAKRSQDLVEFNECWIAERAINARLMDLEIPPGARKIEIASSENGSVLIMADTRDPEAALFSQVNTRQNEVLKARVQELASIQPNWIMDLYSGSGNLTRPLAEKFAAPILAVELSRSATERAGAISNVEWRTGDVGKVLASLEPKPGAGLIVLDPPRTGCSDEVIRQVLRHSPKQIVYVSCNPTTFSRDSVKLVQDGKYKTTHVQGLDMFPQTEHVELIGVLCAAT